MNRETILGLVRHVLTFAGGALAAQGWASEGELTELIGGLMTVIGAIWSIVDKRRRAAAATTEGGSQ